MKLDVRGELTITSTPLVGHGDYNKDQQRPHRLSPWSN